MIVYMTHIREQYMIGSKELRKTDNRSHGRIRSQTEVGPDGLGNIACLQCNNKGEAGVVDVEDDVIIADTVCVCWWIDYNNAVKNHHQQIIGRSALNVH